ncbi:MAG: hypothetical protein LC754_14655 [Acidobacteria bacterium]|nr:hypothetical protein [Acidobacteriota bacterium]
MRDLTKSMMSYTWAMSLFGVQQMLNIMKPQRGQQHPATDAFNNVTQATEEEFDGVAKAAFRAGDNLQRGLVDLTFGIFSPGAFNQGGASRMSSNIGQQSADAIRQGMRVMEQTAGMVGQTMQGAASAASSAAQQGAGWAAAAATPGAGAYTRPTTAGTSPGGAARTDARGGAASGAQTTAGWGPMPSQGSGR